MKGKEQRKKKTMKEYTKEVKPIEKVGKNAAEKR